jgi:hypothetical protein
VTPAKASAHLKTKMKKKTPFNKFLIAPVLIAALSFGVSRGNAAAPDPVIEWNEIMQNTVAAVNANFQARSDAIVQLAVYEAVNAITGDHEPYLGTISAPAGASAEAAAIAAAYRTLVSLFPSSAPSLDASRANSLAAIADGPAMTPASQWAKQPPPQCCSFARTTGSNAQNVPYTPGSDPGDWRPTPPALAVASQPGWGLVTPFALEPGCSSVCRRRRRSTEGAMHGTTTK